MDGRARGRITHHMLLATLRAGLLLCDVPTPALVVDHSSAAAWRGLDAGALDAAIADSSSALLTDLLYVHTSVTAGRDASAGAVGTTTLPLQVTLASLDCSAAQAGGPDAFLGLGVNNHLTGGYYWGRSTGPGASMPAPGVVLRAGADADSPLCLLRESNSNDGKRSEWCEFLTAGDQLQIVPGDVRSALAAFDTLVGITRDGHRGVPRGAEPVVSAAWTREGGAWSRLPWSEAFDVDPKTLPKGAADFLASWEK